jgi:hypothetical protein
MKGIIFEHGEAGCCLWGSNYEKNCNSLCHHCHVHCLPIDVDIRDGIRKYLPKEIIVYNHEDLMQVREKVLFSAPYLYFENVLGVGYVYPVDKEIPRQFLRTLVAQSIGCAEKSDWIKYSGVELFNITKNELQKSLLVNWEEKC